MAKKTAIEKDIDLSPTYTALRQLQSKFQKRFDSSFAADDFEDVAILENAIEAFKNFEATLWHHLTVINEANEKDKQTDLNTLLTIESQSKYIELLESNYLHLYGLFKRGYIHKPTAADTRT